MCYCSVKFRSVIKMSLSEMERITVLMMRGYGDRVRSYEEVVHLFNDRFPDRPPISKSTVFKTVKRFEDTGSVKDRPRSGRSLSATNEDKSLEILQTFVEEPTTSIRNAASHHDVSSYSVLKVLKRNSYHPYKVKLVQELSEDDFDRRLEFCEIMMTRCDQSPNFLANVVFSDEATFTVHGQVSRHNCRFWSDENPHWMRESHTQRPEKINVWAGIVDTHIVGPFIINGTLDGNSYRLLLINSILPALRDLLGQNFNRLWFQQDGAPPHYAAQARALLDLEFHRRWIGRRGEIEWPPRSPDLNPLDYFFWGFLKQKVYKTKPANIRQLTERITEEARRIPPDVLHNVVREFYNRLAHCQTTQGQHFEHLL